MNECYNKSKDDKVGYVEIDLLQEHHLDLLRDFYRRYMKEYFPVEDERESLDNMLEYLDKKSKGHFGSEGDNYHILLVQHNDEVAGGAVFDYSAKCNCGFLEYIVIDKAMHGRKRLINEKPDSSEAKKLHHKVVSILENDAKIARHPALDAVIAEIRLDVEDKTPAAGKKRRFFKSLNYKRLDFRYTQPSLFTHGAPVEGFDLCILTNRRDWENDVLSEDVAMILKEYARIAMRIVPENDPVIQNMIVQLNELENQKVLIEEIEA